MQDRIIYIIISILLCVSIGEAESFDFPTERSDALGGTSLLSSPTPSEQLQNGSPLMLSEKLSLGFGYKRQYDLKDLDFLYSAVSYRIQNYNLIIGFSQLGNPNLYTKKNMRFGLLFTKYYFSIGSFVTGEFHDFNNHYEPVNGYSFGLSLQYKHQNFLLSAVVDNINRPSVSANSLKTEQKLTIFGELIGIEKYKTTLKFSLQKGQKNKFGIGETIKITESGTLLFGFSTAPVTFGGGLELQIKNNTLIYNSSYHPVLGLTHTVSFLIKLLHN